MFREYGCGCIVSEVQGRVRICDRHRLSKGTGDGGMAFTSLRGKSRKYPGNGEMVRGWTGR